MDALLVLLALYAFSDTGASKKKKKSVINPAEPAQPSEPGIDVTPGAIDVPTQPLEWGAWLASLADHLNISLPTLAPYLAQVAEEAGANSAFAPLVNLKDAIKNNDGGVTSLPILIVAMIKLCEALVGPGKLYDNAPSLETDIVEAFALDQDNEYPNSCKPRSWGYDSIKPDLAIESPGDYGMSPKEWSAVAPIFWDLANNKRPWCTTWEQVSSLPAGDFPLWQNLGLPAPHLRWMAVEMYNGVTGALPPDLATVARYIDFARAHTS